MQAAIDYGGETMADVTKMVRRRKLGIPAAELTHAAIEDGVLKYKSNQLANAVQIYMVLPIRHQEIIFDKLIKSGRPLARQLAWQLAATRPSRLVATSVERELDRALQDGDEESILVPQMAMALQANRLTGAYTYARQGLMIKGHEAFAEAMIALDPQRASVDLMTYIARAPAEELRQLTLSSVNVYSCVAALKHMTTHPVSLAHPDAEKLFNYAVSRNTALADLANVVIQNYLPRRTEHLAAMLSRMPVWTQIAYLEGARRTMTPKVGLLLSELRRVSSQVDVLDELSEVR
jgi:hypothetical protein